MNRSTHPMKLPLFMLQLDSRLHYRAVLDTRQLAKVYHSISYGAVKTQGAPQVYIPPTRSQELHTILEHAWH
jgi:hypothetical protein